MTVGIKLQLCLVLAMFIGLGKAADYKDPHCTGNRHGIVHLFEWKWSDIARECETFLGPMGYCGVQTSPANENRVITSPNRPWWERYQPISYKLTTRSGNEGDFKDMVRRCNSAGVRIYVDVVVNHMCGSGGSGQGTGGTSFNADSLQFPGVPFGPNDFNDQSSCPTGDLQIHDYNNAQEVRNCRLVGLLDLESSDYVVGKVADFLNHLIDLGVAGFRVDAAKHMWPSHISNILGRVKDVTMGGRPFVYQEVIDMGGEAIKGDEYLGSGRITNFKFGRELAKVFRKGNPMKYLGNWGTGWGMWAGGDVVNFIDNHDNQRGHGGAGEVLTHWESRPYKAATAFMLAHPYGVPRVMSSYEYNRANNWEGPPHNGDYSIKDVGINSDKTCSGGWSCEHRWREIYNMIAFRNIANGQPLSNWWSGSDYQVAFSRGNQAFIAFNLESYDMDTTIQTGLSAGTYCDVISGDLDGGKCTGSSVTVNGDGSAHITLSGSAFDPILAIHAGAKLGSNARRY